jgi:hydrogenase expression/formation protein HypC
MTGADMTGSEMAGTDLPMPAPRAAGPGPAGLAECHADVCITCSDTAVAVRVVQLLDDDLAIVDTGSGTTEEVSVALVIADVGDTILVHAREAIAVIQP